MSLLKTLLIVCALLWATAVPRADDASRVALEYELKAVFISKLVSFVQWPAAAFESPDEPLILVVLGDDPFGDVLEQALSETRASGRSLVVERVARLEALEKSHVLFVSDSERENTCEILRAVDGRPVLSISDFSGFSDRGGVLTLKMRRQRVRLSFNSAAYRRTGLTISAKLLQISTEVAEDPCR